MPTRRLDLGLQFLPGWSFCARRALFQNLVKSIDRIRYYSRTGFSDDDRAAAPGARVVKRPGITGRRIEKRTFFFQSVCRPFAGQGFAQRNAGFVLLAQTLRASAEREAISEPLKVIQNSQFTSENQTVRRQYGHTQPEIKKSL
ncbi:MULTISPECIES: hypothetical protein [Methylobacterium]|uniref:hypothetical protein n=1 Tax=Methylobacterium TaxID=407 RepID=UPI0012E90F8E|nr:MULTISPECIES: hypothetical protein [Methylobacterium]MCI9881052.1 hypothetical protein [Methylobacterium goesingense]